MIMVADLVPLRAILFVLFYQIKNCWELCSTGLLCSK